MDAVLRYHYHAQLGIDGRAVAPFKEEWMDRALALVPAGPPPLVSQVGTVHNKQLDNVLHCLGLDTVGNQANAVC